MVALVGFCMSGGQTGLNAFAHSCYPALARGSGVSWMLGHRPARQHPGLIDRQRAARLRLGFEAIISALIIPAGLAAAGIAIKSLSCALRI